MFIRLRTETPIPVRPSLSSLVFLLLNAPHASSAGEWRNDFREGEGTFKYHSGASYTGQWVANQKHGHGTLIDDKGLQYTGAWLKDQRHGQGTQYVAAFAPLYVWILDPLLVLLLFLL